MLDFAHTVSETFNLSREVAHTICTAYEKGFSAYYLIEYEPILVMECEEAQIWDVYDFLDSVAALKPKKTRLINALKKADSLTQVLEQRIGQCTRSCEIDDLLLPHLPKPRSKGNQAINKGLGELAELYQAQEAADIEERVEAAVGKHASLKSSEDVKSGIKDILAERFAYDETVRAMAREFAGDDGFFDITVKSKSDKRWNSYVGKLVSITELSDEELLHLLAAEERKEIRIKLGVQLFRITEVLRHHFIENPDFPGFDLLCEAIDDCWSRLLQPIIERDIKADLRKRADTWALRVISPNVDAILAREDEEGAAVAFRPGNRSDLIAVSVSRQGRLLAATSIARALEGDARPHDRLRQFVTRHRPAVIILPDDETSERVSGVLTATLGTLDNLAEVIHQKPDGSIHKIASSPWMEQHCSGMDEPLRRAFAGCLVWCMPLRCVLDIGIRYFSIHALQRDISEPVLQEFLRRRVMQKALRRGIVAREIADSGIDQAGILSAAQTGAIAAAAGRGDLNDKDSIRSVPGIDTIAFTNCSGFIVFPQSTNAFDITVIHPDHIAWVEDICSQLGITSRTLLKDPECIRSIQTEEASDRIFIEKRLITQIRAGQRYAGMRYAPVKVQRRTKLSEIDEDSIISGRVTNITPFGVFVDIHAVCDGLIHISQLADDYIETPEQVVSVGEQVDVRVMKVDAKKRRVSLSMKRMGSRSTAKVSPSRRHLDELASHFQNR